jgi:hypothetical protein
MRIKVMQKPSVSVIEGIRLEVFPAGVQYEPIPTILPHSYASCSRRVTKDRLA